MAIMGMPGIMPPIGAPMGIMPPDIGIMPDIIGFIIPPIMAGIGIICIAAFIESLQSLRTIVLSFFYFGD